MEPFDVKSELTSEHTIRVACSLNNFNEQMQTVINKLEPIQICRLGGAGNKVNRIALDEVDTYCQPAPGLKFWDLCAPECIVRAMGGLCTNQDGNRFVYDKERNPTGVKLSPFYIGKT